MDRKQLKTSASQTVKKHYFLLTVTTVLGAVIGASFLALPTTSTTYYQSLYQYLTSGTYAGFNSFIRSFVRTNVDIINQLVTYGFAIAKTTDGKLIFGMIGWMIIVVLVWIFFKETFNLVINRIFLEARTYDKVPFQHGMFLISAKKWFKASIALFIKNLYLFLWSFTVVGGLIKSYSYLLVPYILAENPSLSGNQAVTLSRRMMDEHKWEAFVLRLSLLGWDILNVCTFGLAGALYVNQYESSVYTEYYAYVREEAKRTNVEGAELLSDTYLFAKADAETLAAAYKSTKMDEMYIQDTEVQLSGAKKFCAESLSLWAGNKKQMKVYQGVENLKCQLAVDKDALAGEQYPDRLSPFYTRENIHFAGNMNASRTYSIWILLLFFILIAIGSWVYYNVGMMLYTQQYLNYDIFHGPWMPMNACIVIFSLMLFTKLRKKPVAAFLSTMVLSAVITYLTAYLLQNNYGMSLWNCSAQFININGKASLEASFNSAVLSSFLIYFILPGIDQWLSKKNQTAVLIITIVLTVLFAADIVYSIGNPNTVNLSTSSSYTSISETI